MIIKSSYIYEVSGAWHINFSFIVFNNDNSDLINLLNSEARSLRIPGISFLLADLAQNNNNSNDGDYLLSD